jgi:hypothetical protein
MFSVIESSIFERISEDFTKTFTFHIISAAKQPKARPTNINKQANKAI